MIPSPVKHPSSVHSVRSASKNNSYNFSNNHKQTMPLGITLSGVHEFIVSVCGGRQQLRNLTCGEVKDQFILPLCTNEHKAYVEIVEHERFGSDHNSSADWENHLSTNGEAIMIVCHGMDDLFLEFVDALDRYFESDSSETAEDMTLWIDIFCLNYYEVLHYEDPKIIRQWLQDLERMFYRYGNTLIVLAPWDSRSVFESPFCLFQLFIALEEGFLVDISISKYEEDRLSRMFYREYNHSQGLSTVGTSMGGNSMMDTMLSSSTLIENFSEQFLNIHNYSQEGVHWPLQSLQILANEFLFRSIEKEKIVLKDLIKSDCTYPSKLDDPLLSNANNPHEEHFRSVVKQTLQKWLIDLTRSWMYFSPTVVGQTTRQKQMGHESPKASQEDKADGCLLSGTSPTNHAMLNRMLSGDNRSLKLVGSIGEDGSEEDNDYQILRTPVHNLNKGGSCFEGWREEEKCYLKSIDQVQSDMRHVSKELEFLEQQYHEDQKFDSRVSRVMDSNQLMQLKIQQLDFNRQLCKYYHELYSLYMHHHYFADAEIMLLQHLELQQQQTRYFSVIGEDKEIHKNEEATMITILKLAKLCVIQKKIQMAELFYQSYLAKIYGETVDSDHNCNSENNLSDVKWRYRKVTNTKDFILILQNIANFYYAQASYMKALPLFEDCYQLSLEVNGHEHLTTLHTASMLANTYVHVQMEEKAIEMARDCVVIATALHGRDSVHVSQYETNFIRIVENKLVKRVEEEVLFTRYQDQESFGGLIKPSPIIITSPSFYGGGRTDDDSFHGSHRSKTGPRESFDSELDGDAVSFYSHNQSRSSSVAPSPHFGNYSTTHNMRPTFGGLSSIRSEVASLHSTSSVAKITSSPSKMKLSPFSSTAEASTSPSATSVCVIC